MIQKTRTDTLSAAFQKGSLDIYLDSSPLIRQLGLNLGGEGWGSHPFRESAPKLSVSQGSDLCGTYEEASFISTFDGRESDGMEARMSPAYEAGLRFRFYEGRGLLSCHLLYKGKAPLSAQGAAKVSMPLLQGFEAGLSAWRNSPWWTVPQYVSSPKQVASPSQQLLWKRQDGLYALLLPTGGNGAKASLGAPGGDFGVEIANHSNGFNAAETPLFVLAAGKDPYALNEALFTLASLDMNGSFLPRRKKAFPEIFEGIGWCSWNTYYYDVNESKLLASARSFAEAKFPIRYMLVDDGWSALKDIPEKPINPDKPWPGTGKMLWDFQADPVKFPRGFKGLLPEIKKLCGVEQLGVWHAFLGYWSYIHPESPIAKKLKGNLMQAASGGLVPDPRDGKASAFYDAWYEYLKSEGVSFLKVDDQGSVQFAYKGLVPLQDAGSNLEHALQTAAAARFGNAVINCMAMSWENVSGLDMGNVSRCSNDFLPTVPDNGPQHLACNIYNSFWLSGASTPDFDMFESSHAEGEHHALLRAISGGPVYFTDKPGHEDWDLLRKLITADGRLLRADEPARPTRDSLFSDTLEKPVPLKGFTRAGKGGAVAAFNVFRGNEAIKGSVSSSDIEGMEGESCIVYEHFSGRTRLLQKGASLNFELAPAGKELFLFAPIDGDFAVIGLLDKFLSLRAVEGVEMSPQGVRILLREAGRLGFFSAKKVASVTMAGHDAEFKQGSDGWCEVSPASSPEGTCEVQVTFQRP